MEAFPGFSLVRGKSNNGNNFGKNNLQEKLNILTSKTGYSTKQENGQRFFGPPTDWIGEAPKNSEAFISRLPYDCYEDEIYEFCSQVGQIYLIRLMVTFDGTNRGFCFVTFASEYEALMASQILSKIPIRRGNYVNVEISHQNRSVEIIKINPKFNESYLKQEICNSIDSVKEVRLWRNPKDLSWKATLFFENHQQAAVARRRLNEIALSRWGNDVKVFLVKHKDKMNMKTKFQVCNGEFSQSGAKNYYISNY